MEFSGRYFAIAWLDAAGGGLVLGGCPHRVAKSGEHGVHVAAAFRRVHHARARRDELRRIPRIAEKGHRDACAENDDDVVVTELPARLERQVTELVR
jgi:hypothetical protein